MRRWTKTGKDGAARDLSGALPEAMGRSGEEVTANLRTIRSIPLTGEQRAVGAGRADAAVRSSRRSHDADEILFGDERAARGAGAGAIRQSAGCTAGAVRVLEPNITAERRLDFYSYFFLQDGRPGAGDAVGVAGGT